MRNRPVKETSNWQHETFVRDKHPCHRRDSNSQSQQANDRRPTPFGVWSADYTSLSLISLIELLWSIGSILPHIFTSVFVKRWIVLRMCWFKLCITLCNWSNDALTVRKFFSFLYMVLFSGMWISVLSFRLNCFLCYWSWSVKTVNPEDAVWWILWNFGNIRRLQSDTYQKKGLLIIIDFKSHTLPCEIFVLKFSCCKVKRESVKRYFCD